MPEIVLEKKSAAEAVNESNCFPAYLSLTAVYPSDYSLPHERQ